MTDRNALTDLIEAVESGHDDEVDGLACALFHGSGQCRDVVSAYHGSLDAAKALHEALLPGWDWCAGAGPIQGSNGCANLIGWQQGEIGPIEADNPRPGVASRYPASVGKNRI